MTIQESIRELQEWLDGCCGEELNDAKEAFKMAIGALDRQIPKKPKMPLDAYWVCPVCGKKVDHPYEHCTRCGQAIDWGKENA